MQNKRFEFHSDEIELAEVAKVMSHPARIRILKILTRCQSCVCGSIVEQMPLAQATVSQHLKELKRVGLIKGTVEGPKTCYCLDTSRIKQARDAFIKLFSTFNCC